MVQLCQVPLSFTCQRWSNQNQQSAFGIEKQTSLRSKVVASLRAVLKGGSLAQITTRAKPVTPVYKVNLGKNVMN